MTSHELAQLLLAKPDLPVIYFAGAEIDDWDYIEACSLLDPESNHLTYMPLKLRNEVRAGQHYIWVR